jgi:hypothetical protein
MKVVVRSRLAGREGGRLERRGLGIIMLAQGECAGPPSELRSEGVLPCFRFSHGHSLIRSERWVQRPRPSAYLC